MQKLVHSLENDSCCFCVVLFLCYTVTHDSVIYDNSSILNGECQQMWVWPRNSEAYLKKESSSLWAPGHSVTCSKNPSSVYPSSDCFTLVEFAALIMEWQQQPLHQRPLSVATPVFRSTIGKGAVVSFVSYLSRSFKSKKIVLLSLRLRLAQIVFQTNYATVLTYRSFTSLPFTGQLQRPFVIWILDKRLCRRLGRIYLCHRDRRGSLEFSPKSAI
ncbi:hypothetical protein CPB84DRAFT_1778336, partial [Gymnopilus junonius]